MHHSFTANDQEIGYFSNIKCGLLREMSYHIGAVIKGFMFRMKSKTMVDTILCLTYSVESSTVINEFQSIFMILESPCNVGILQQKLPTLPFCCIYMIHCDNYDIAIHCSNFYTFLVFIITHTTDTGQVPPRLLGL